MGIGLADHISLSLGFSALYDPSGGRKMWRDLADVPHFFSLILCLGRSHEKNKVEEMGAGRCFSFPPEGTDPNSLMGVGVIEG